MVFVKVWYTIILKGEHSQQYIPFGFPNNIGHNSILNVVPLHDVNNSCDLFRKNTKPVFNDPLSHFGLFIKLIDRGLPASIVYLLANWFSKS